MSKKPISAIADINPSVSKIVKPNDFVTFLGMTDVSNNGRITNNIRMHYKDIKNGFTKFQENDILFAKITPCMENGKGAIAKGLYNHVGFGSTEFHVLRANESGKPEFIYQILQSEDFRLKAEAMMTGSAGQKRVPTDFFYKHEIFIPDLPTQNKIAKILSTTDEVIEQTRALIEKYKNIKKGMLHDLFTRGIDPKNNKLRPTKEQNPELYHETKLGWIPKGWLCNPIKKIASLIVSNVDKKSFNNEIPVSLCNYMDVYNNSWINSDLNFMLATATLSEINKFQLLINDVLFTKDSETPEDIAVPSVVTELVPNLICGYHLGILRPFKLKTNGKFLMYLLHSEEIKRQFIRVANGSTRYGLTKDSINEVLVPYPSFYEQELIAERLEAIDKKIETEQAYLEKTQKIKQGLMQDLLTGNVPV